MIKIYTLTSSLHNEESVTQVTNSFLSTLNCDYQLVGEDFSKFNTGGLDLIYIKTGGTEGLFRTMFEQLEKKPRKFYLLTSGLSNSLAASMEILSFLGNHGLTGEILHGDSDFINHRINVLSRVIDARDKLSKMQLGVIGTPSDWLISSGVDYDAVRATMGINLIDIPMNEVVEEYYHIQLNSYSDIVNKAGTETLKRSAEDAMRLYEALKVIVKRYKLDGFTIRCFDLLTSIKNTGCLALAHFNADGVIATCEGDIPAMLSMSVSQVLTGFTGFQANPAHINPLTGEMKFAHCTIPFNMVERFELDTHFESGIGVGICGYSTPGAVTIFKMSGDGKRHFAEEGMLTECQSKPNLCRTQQLITLNDINATKYFLTSPIGNHHIIIPGNHKELINEMLA